jgi:hypothetical protein
MSQALAYNVTCLSKPIQIDDLIREINEIVGEKKIS